LVGLPDAGYDYDDNWDDFIDKICTC
jgi:hypothetical protein